MGADKGGGVEDSSAGFSGVVLHLLPLPGVLILPFCFALKSFIFVIAPRTQKVVPDSQDTIFFSLEA